MSIINKIVAYCDGGCRGNQYDKNIGGWGVYINFGNKEVELCGYAKNTTNNIMELTACIEALKAITQKDCPTEIIMDSNYVILGVNEWMPNWIKRGWRKSDGKKIENLKLWQKLNELKSQFSNIQFIKCIGHSIDPSDIYQFGNFMADTLANEAMDELERRMMIEN